jgi:hypothetical protein
LNQGSVEPAFTVSGDIRAETDDILEDRYLADGSRQAVNRTAAN